jgi:glycosyltransferase involved in cell wall biosynthesis
MKILFVLHLPPPIHGSAAVGLQIKESKVINDNFQCRFINLGTSVSIDEIGKRKLIKVFRYLVIIFNLLKNVIFHRPDLCYFSLSSQFVPFYKDTLLISFVKLLRIKLVYHFHNKGISLRQYKYIDDKLYRFVLKKTNVILLSERLYPDVEKYVCKSQVYYCANGINDSETQHSLTLLHVNKASVQIFFLSNLIVSKGIFVLLDACKILQEKSIAFHCTMVGDVGDVSEHWFNLKLVEMGLSNNINYIGKRYGNEKDALFANSDIFVHPTLNDCFPLVLLEAMKNSLPVISTFEGGIPDIVEDGVTGYLVPKNDSNALADKLEILIKNYDLRVQMGKNGRKRFETEFTLNIFEQKLKSILEQIE